MGLILWAAPLSAILVMFLTKTTKIHHIISVLASVIEVVVTWILTYQVMVEGQIAYSFVGRLFYLDAFSIILLNTSLYPIIRTVSIVNKNMESSVFTGRLLIGIGLISLATAAIFIITQKDYKRLLAYSSIEHIGIITIAMGVFTPAAVFAGLFHMINHSFTKSMLFLTSGNILQKYGTREIGRVQSLIKVLPFSGTVFLIGLFAIGGTPPFSIFASEFSILISIFDNNGFILGVTIIALLTLVFVGIVSTLFRMFYYNNKEEDVPPGEINKYGVAVILIMLVIISITGLYMPEAIFNLMVDAQNVITGGI